MSKTVFITLILLLAMCAGGFAQSNELLDEILSQEQAQFGHSLYVVLSAGGRIDETASVATVYSRYVELGWQLSHKAIDEPVSVRELSYIIMKALDLSGGIMYSILPSPRYAHRELVYRGVISGQVPPTRIVSGETVLRYLGAVLRMREGQL